MLVFGSKTESCPGLYSVIRLNMFEILLNFIIECEIYVLFMLKSSLIFIFFVKIVKNVMVHLVFCLLITKLMFN